MDIKEFYQIIRDYGGTINQGIDWAWAIFPDDAKGQECFDKLKGHCEHRGYYPANPNSPNESLRQGGFRFR